MKFELVIRMDNAAFEDDPGKELERILHALGTQVANNPDFAEMVESKDTYPVKVSDINGNTVGSFALSDK